jgi:hypothetical protein
MATPPDVFEILQLLVPLAEDIAAALKKRSPGGKRITAAEWLGLVFKHGPVIVRALNVQAE